MTADGGRGDATASFVDWRQRPCGCDFSLDMFDSSLLFYFEVFVAM